MHAVLLAAEEAHVELAMPPIWYGIIALSVLMAALLVTYAFRNIGARN